ncbi:transposase domain-containing protein [Vibrio metschnikovii]|uniref:transposase domain-containing protein n=1 Tax=Vibrio metschnikovii TaxID=28172 RepID=UPI002FC8D518
MFADTSQGAKASAVCYSLVETAKLNGLEPYRYLHPLLTQLPYAETLEQIEALLPWNLAKD